MFKYILLYALIALFRHTKKIKLAIICEWILIFCVFKLSGYSMLQVDFRKIGWYIICGYVLSFFLLNFTYITVFWKLPKIKISLNITYEDLFSVLWEEIIWRFCFFGLCYWLDISRIYLFFFMTLENFFFILSHLGIGGKNLRNNIEMFVYSYFLLILGGTFQGMNIGLHLGRNILCKVEKENYESD